jgi:hypothetical protein
MQIIQTILKKNANGVFRVPDILKKMKNNLKK